MGPVAARTPAHTQDTQRSEWSIDARMRFAAAHPVNAPFLRFAFYLSDKTDLFSGSCLGIGDVCGNASYGLYFTSATPLDTR